MRAKHRAVYSHGFAGTGSNMKPHPQFLFKVHGLALPQGSTEDELLSYDFVSFFFC